MSGPKHSFFSRFFLAYRKNTLASLSLKFFILLVIVGIYAPFFASSKPFLVEWNGKYFFPLFRYLWFPGFYTKSIDLFFNVLMLTFPFFYLSIKFLSGKLRLSFLGGVAICHVGLFLFVLHGGIQDPEGDARLRQMRSERILEAFSNTHPESIFVLPQDPRSWVLEQQYMNEYEKLNMLVRAKYRLSQHESLKKFAVVYAEQQNLMIPTLYDHELRNEAKCLSRLQNKIAAISTNYHELLNNWQQAVAIYKPQLMKVIRENYNFRISQFFKNEEIIVKAPRVLDETNPLHQKVLETRQILLDYNKLITFKHFLEDKRSWISQESEKVKIHLSPLLSHFHWEDDAGGSRKFNQYLHWWQLTRINRKDLLASLIFGIRIALLVGGLGVIIALCLGVFFGLTAGYFGGIIDIILSRFIEIWETMPMLFILMLIVSITQMKSLILDTVLLGCFGWTGISRYIRVETLRQRNMPYVLTAVNLGYSHYHIMVHQILPNAMISVIALLPFSMMAMISCEAGLTFLGLGEESSASWGNLMREGVSAFPAESAILWPPAVVLTLFLIAIALIGDGIRDALDPKLQ